MNNKYALPYIENLQTYVPGKPIEDLAREQKISNIIKLASNENPYGPSPLVLDNLVKNINCINRYPDPDQFDLKISLAKFYNIMPENLVIGNGSDELIQMIMRVFVSSEDNIIFPKYSFMSYKISAKSVDAGCIESDINQDWTNNLDDILKKINYKTKLICIANPNNPTGTYTNIKIITNFIKQVPNNILVLLDEAYYEYIKYNDNTEIKSDYQDDSIKLIKQFKNLIITRTFSKAYGLAGLRAGYCITDPNLASAINKIKQPFNVNRLVQHSAGIALTDQDYIKKVVDINKTERDNFYTELYKLDIKYIKSHTNFVTIHTSSPESSHKLYNYLLTKGIIIRPISNYGLDKNLRISIGLPDENKTFIEALNSYENLI